MVLLVLVLVLQQQHSGYKRMRLDGLCLAGAMEQAAPLRPQLLLGDSGDLVRQAVSRLISALTGILIAIRLLAKINI